MCAGFFCQAFKSGPVHVDDKEMRFGCLIFVRRKENAAVFFIDEIDTLDFPFTLRQPFFQVSAEVVMIKMAPSVHITPEEKSAAIFKEMEVLVKVNPGSLFFLMDGFRLSCFQVHRHEFNMVLPSI